MLNWSVNIDVNQIINSAIMAGSNALMVLLVNKSISNKLDSYQGNKKIKNKHTDDNKEEKEKKEDATKE